MTQQEGFLFPGRLPKSHCIKMTWNVWGYFALLILSQRSIPNI